MVSEGIILVMCFLSHPNTEHTDQKSSNIWQHVSCICKNCEWPRNFPSDYLHYHKEKANYDNKCQFSESFVTLKNLFLKLSIWLQYTNLPLVTVIMLMVMTMRASFVMVVVICLRATVRDKCLVFRIYFTFGLCLVNLLIIMHFLQIHY